MIALVSASSEYAEGARIPNMVNDSTIAIKDHQSVSFNIGANG